jgi:Fe-S cluster assembly ATP-binding protein
MSVPEGEFGKYQNCFDDVYIFPEEFSNVEGMELLVVEGLSVSVEDKEILHGVNLEIKAGGIHALFGPNGSGKTSLLMAIMGVPPYKVTEGRILFRGEDITDLPVNMRARRGMGLSFQRPPTIRGLRTRKMVEICSGGKADEEALASILEMKKFLDRDVNYGFSGGEIKRADVNLRGWADLKGAVAAVVVVRSTERNG